MADPNKAVQGGFFFSKLINVQGKYHHQFHEAESLDHFSTRLHETTRVEAIFGEIETRKMVLTRDQSRGLESQLQALVAMYLLLTCTVHKIGSIEQREQIHEISFSESAHRQWMI